MSATTMWRTFHRPEYPYAIPVDFIRDLIDGKIVCPNFSRVKLYDSKRWVDFDRGWIEQFTKRFSEQFIQGHLVFSAEEIIEGINESEKSIFISKLLEIVYCHSNVDILDARDLDLANKAMGILGYNYNDDDPIYNLIKSYISGSGLCMHVASLGCAIARANGARAEIMGHPHYFSGRVGQHYGIGLYDNHGKRHLIIPRGAAKSWWGKRKNHHFVTMPEEPYEYAKIK